jgi:hypothetical protein
MAAAGTKTARGECIPAGATAIVEKFRIAARRAKPAVCWFGLPFTERAADAAEIRILVASSARCGLTLCDRYAFLKQ